MFLFIILYLKQSWEQSFHMAQIFIYPTKSSIKGQREILGKHKKVDVVFLQKIGSGWETIKLV